MTKKKLIDVLSKWPDDAQVELSIAHDINAEDLVSEDKVWLEIAYVESIRIMNKDVKVNEKYNKHCLICGGKVIME